MKAMSSRYPANKLSVSRNFLTSLLLVVFALGVFIGSRRALLAPPAPGAGRQQSTALDENFKYIRGSVSAGEPDQRNRNRELAPFRYKIKAIIDDKIRKHEIEKGSIYFRDLNNGNWFGIKEKEKFSPKNLLKLPLMIAYFRWAEANPSVLRKRIDYQGDHSPPATDPAIKTGLEAGSQYSVHDLIFRMIADDDDRAYDLLFAAIPPARLDKVFKDLNVDYDPHNRDDEMSLRSLASFYRVLFNASYLNEEYSEIALRYLSKSSLRHAMASVVPLNIEIAAKSGQRTVKTVENGKEVELEQMHEFGIVYHPRHPFLIGIMVRGENAPALNKTIRDVTKAVYEEIDSQS